MDDTFWNNSTFFPGADSSILDSLLNEVYKKREVEFSVFCLQLGVSEPEIFSETGFVDYFEKFRNGGTETRQILVSDPHYFAWFIQTLRARTDTTLLRQKLMEFERVLQLIKTEEKSKQSLSINGHSVVVERFRLDPLISDLALPEYRLPKKKRQELFNREVDYPESYFHISLEIALERIRRAWLDAYLYFPQFVKIIVDMVDGEYTSYSSADHTGTIFVSTDNSPLVALEEYLIHEYGHQILYHLMELDPLVKNEVEKVYVLPWSGNERDFYGYFHAFFIYTFMALYLEKVRCRSAREQRRIELRRKHIVNGLEEALIVLGSADAFTEHGFRLFNNLVRAIEELRSNLDRHRELSGV